MQKKSDIFIGLMSGTSLDGADAVACRLSHEQIVFLAHAYLPYPISLRKSLLDLLTPVADEITRI